MYIRRTSIKSRKNGTSYYTYRLVESVRTEKGVSQRTLLNLGHDFSFPRESWPDLSCRIVEIISGQMNLFKLSAALENAAQRYAALIIQARNRECTSQNGTLNTQDYQNADIDSFELIRPRSIGTEHVACNALKQLRLVEKLKDIGFNRHQISAAVGTIVGRMIEPGSELATHYWLQNHTGLGELIDYDYEGMSLTRMYEISDQIFKHKETLEKHLYARQRNLFQFAETITLYDLTNTYFEGSCKYNKLAAHGKSKEKRTDCPLVTLGLVLDSSGFPKKSEVFAGNVSEPKTLQEIIKKLQKPLQAKQPHLFENKTPVVILDAGIATDDNVKWLKNNKYAYLVVSRKRHREFIENEAIEVKKEQGYTVKVFKKKNEETGETELYCHSTKKEGKERAIQDRFSTCFEEALKKLDSGLYKKGCVKNYDKVVEKLGRLKQKYSKAAKNYKVTINKQTDKATSISWERKLSPDSTDSHPGVYCLRTNLDTWDESTLWRTYTMLTDLEAVFKSLKSELGLRPVFHQKTKRVSCHLFISLLAYHLVHTIRYQLKSQGIFSSWSDLRKQLCGQDRITVSVKCQNGDMVHVRKSTKPEPRQQIIYDALNLTHYPGGTVKTVV
jgi:transposase